MSRGIWLSICTYALIILVVIAGFFLLDIDRISLYLWAFGSLIFSLVVSLVSTIFLVSNNKNKNVLFFTSGFQGVIWTYQIIVIISLLFINSFKHVGTFVFFEIVIFAIFIISSIVINISSKHIYDKDKVAQEKLENGDYNKPKRGGF